MVKFPMYGMRHHLIKIIYAFLVQFIDRQDSRFSLVKANAIYIMVHFYFINQMNCYESHLIWLK